MQFHEKKVDLFDFASYFAWTFLNFWPTVKSSTHFFQFIPVQNSHELNELENQWNAKCCHFHPD